MSEKCNIHGGRSLAACDHGDDNLTHEHRYSGQVLRHSHPDGDKPHGYFGHPEDYPPEVSPDELYNGAPLDGA